MAKKPHDLIPLERVESRIYAIREQRVMLDQDLAELYETETRVLVQAVKRNIERFPSDFMFQLSKEELEDWRSQIVMSNPGAKMGLRRRPYAFTEQGVAMLSSVLRSDRAVRVNIAIMRVFVRLRAVLTSHEDILRRLEAIEDRSEEHDEQLTELFEAVSRLLHPPEDDHDGRERIGFKPGK